MLLVPFVLVAQSDYYYKRGEYFAEYTDNPLLWTRAFNEWKIGEQKGEASSARMVIYCYLSGIGTQKDNNAAINLINKWSKKDSRICILNAMLNISPKYKYKNFPALRLQSGIGVDLSLEDIGKKADISKALYYAKYAKEQLNDPYLWFDTEETDMLLIIEGICYDYGIGGYKKDYMQAAKRYNYVVNSDGDKVGGMDELINSATSLKELWSFMVEASTDIMSQTTYDYKLLLYYPTIDGNFNIRNKFNNTAKVMNCYDLYTIKADEFLEAFWRLSDDERIAVYNECDQDVQTIYDNSLRFRLAHYKNNVINMEQSDVDSILLILNNYPKKIDIRAVGAYYSDNIVDVIVKAVRDNDYELYCKGVNLMDMFVKSKIIEQEPTASLDRLKNSMYNNLADKYKNQMQGQLSSAENKWNDYYMSRNRDCNPEAERIVWGYKYVKEDDTTFVSAYRELQNIFNNNKDVWTSDRRKAYNVDTYLLKSNQALAFAEALGFYKDEHNHTLKRKAKSSDLKQFMEKYPTTPYEEYAALLYTQRSQIENDLYAFSKAYSLRTNSPKSEYKELKTLPMSNKMRLAIKEMSKKSFIKEHEQYISQNKDEEFKDKIIGQWDLSYIYK